MASSERDFVQWLARRVARAGVQMTCGVDGKTSVVCGIGDDMAQLDLPAGPLLVSSDILVDGTHFDAGMHDPAVIGRKAAGCSLSDCAAMAVRPLAATVSLVLPRTLSFADAQALMGGLIDHCAAFDCPVVGGDTTSGTGPLTVDVTMLATPYPGIRPVRRSGARAGDGVYITGCLGGSLLGRHLDFVPRVREARLLAERLGERLHAMIDVTDGAAIDADRVAEASGVGIVLDEGLLLSAASAAARQAHAADGRGVLEHVLSDGEDFELLLSADVADSAAQDVGVRRIGTVTAETGLRLRRADGVVAPLAATGFQHL